MSTATGTAMENTPTLAKVGQPAPDFNMPSTKDIETLKENVKLADYKGKWLILLFYPLDFTGVCSTDLTHFSDRFDEIKGLGAEVLGVSTDSVTRTVHGYARRRKITDLGKFSTRSLRIRAANSRVSTTFLSMKRISRSAASSSLTPKACCSIRWLTRQALGARSMKLCACCKLCRPAASARPIGSLGRKRFRSRFGSTLEWIKKSINNSEGR